MAKKKRLRIFGITLFIIVIVIIIIIILIGVYIYTKNNIENSSISLRTYQTTKSCSLFMQEIGNPSMGIPFTWLYTPNQIKCIQFYKNINNSIVKGKTSLGCKVFYANNPCTSDIPIDTKKYLKTYTSWGIGCDKWIINEIKEENFNDLCWNSNTIINLNDQFRRSINKQYRCAITYKKGCSISNQSNKCELVFGNGNVGNRNIIITVEENNKPLSIPTTFDIITALKTIYPYSTYSSNFNVYRAINHNIIESSPYTLYPLEMKKVFSSCGINNYMGDVIIPSKVSLSRCPNARACAKVNIMGEGISMIDISISGLPELYAHELMHTGEAIGESYGDNPQMYTNASVNNVINWILRN